MSYEEEDTCLAIVPRRLSPSLLVCKYVARTHMHTHTQTTTKGALCRAYILLDRSRCLTAQHRVAKPWQTMTKPLHSILLNPKP